MTPFVSVIVPVFGGPEPLRSCLLQLTNQTWPSDRLEILVIDNNPMPRIGAELGESLGVRVLAVSAPGSYAARNAGIRAARGRILAFTDADCLPERDWMERGVAALGARPECGFVGGEVRLFPCDAGAPTAAELYDLVRGFDQERYLRKKRFLPTANLIVHRHVMDRVGLFDPSLRSGGDADWGERAYAAGIRGEVAEGVVVLHPARPTLAEVCRKAARVAGGNLQRGKHSLVSDLVGSLVPDLPKMIRYAMSDRLLGPRQRVSVAGVRMLTGYLKSWERVRIRVGGHPRR